MPGSNAFDHILITPEIVGDITWAETAIQSVHGEISSFWKISGNDFSLKVRIPANCRATIELPQPDPDKITENGIPVKSSQNIRTGKLSNGKIRLEVGSGEYNFTCPL
jgi:alpha-L-rhamnosidase